MEICTQHPCFCQNFLFLRFGGILNVHDVVDDEVAKNALINWSKTPYYILAGPTTVAAVNEMLGLSSDNPKSFLSYDSAKGSDGGAMKISPVGLVSNGDVDKAIKDAITICLPTHFNSTALAGACAVAAAVSEALNDNASIDSIVKAGLKGAKQGNNYAIRNNKELANPSVYRRIELAVEIANKCNGDMNKAMEDLEAIIGSGLSASEAVPCAFGLFVAANGDAQKAIVAAVNIGSDTDTVATIVGAIAGAYCSYYDEEKLQIIDRVNNYDLKLLKDYEIYATEIKGSVDISTIAKTSQHILILGNEAHGVSKELLELASKRIRIDIKNIESLNVAVAGAIAMYELSKN